MRNDAPPLPLGHINVLDLSRILAEDSDVKRVLIDQGSCSEIMYLDLFHGLSLKQSDLQPYDAPLVGISGESIRLMG